MVTAILGPLIMTHPRNEIYRNSPTPIAHKSFLEEIGSETASFTDNLMSQQEPTVLPAQLPYL